MPRYYRILAALLVLLPALTFLAPIPSVRAAGPALRLDPSAIDFGDQQVGASSATKTITLTNAGDAPLKLRGYGLTREYRMSMNAGGCQFGADPPIPPGGNCTFGLSFRPSEPGKNSGTFRVYSNAAGSPHEIALQGNGVVPAGVPSIGQSTTFLTFPLRAVGMASAARTVKLTNFGDVDARIRSISIVGTNLSDFAQTNTCGASLAARTSCAVSVTFTPSADGSRFAALAIDDAAPGSPHTVLLFGETTVAEACFEGEGTTNTCIDPLFFAYWQEHGGLAINGYPIGELRTEQLDDGNIYRVQYFERVRMEYHPFNDPPYKVLLGQFGRFILAGVPNAPTDSAPPKEGYAHITYMSERGVIIHNVRPEFMAYYKANGGLSQFGYPLSEEFEQQLEDGNTYTVQYFERARFEWHPLNDAPFKVELGQFGRQICGTRCR